LYSEAFPVNPGNVILLIAVTFLHLKLLVSAIVVWRHLSHQERELLVTSKRTKDFSVTSVLRFVHEKKADLLFEKESRGGEPDEIGLRHVSICFLLIAHATISQCE
jgi:hypothetical protein